MFGAPALNPLRLVTCSRRAPHVPAAGAARILAAANLLRAPSTPPRPQGGLPRRSPAGSNSARPPRSLLVPRAAAASSSMSSSGKPLSYLKQDEAVKVDEELMGPLGFSVDQLMELAGLSVACSLAEVYPAATHPRVLVVAGPGNNGGDGLVAARHLHHFGYAPSICYPKPTDKALYNGLVTQCQSLALPFVDAETLLAAPLAANYDVVLDAIFGFSFKGAPRPPFAAILDAMKPAASPPPIVSVDIPSGWDVEEGDGDGAGLRPEMLVSLTAPKACARQFCGPHHFLGGRFVPPAIAAKYALSLPAYPGTAQCVRIPSPL